MSLRKLKQQDITDIPIRLVREKKKTDNTKCCLSHTCRFGRWFSSVLLNTQLPHDPSKAALDIYQIGLKI